MIDFLIKSTLSLFVLLAIYHLILEKEKMHQFNRFYLLFCLVFSFVIPFISIEIASVMTTQIKNQNNIRFLEGTTKIIKETNFMPALLWALYGLISLVSITRFIMNIRSITSKIKSNQTIQYQNAKLILVRENTIPHTFFDCIFINEFDYKNRNIEAELYTHELTHVTQKHTLDILLIEILKTIFWFNPIFIFYKKAIQLNHEFLADETVVRSYNDIPFYQSLLLSKANIKQPLNLVSNLNYLVTKKRLLMMTKNTSRTNMTLKKIILIPFFIALFYLISFKSVAMESATTNYHKTKTGNAQKEIPEPNRSLAKVSSISKDTLDTQINPTLQKSDSLTKESALEKTESLIESTPPQYPGGVLEFYKFIGANFKVPAELKTSGKVYLTFMVEKDGSLSEFEIIKDLGFGTAEEVVRVLKLSPKWVPGKENNEAVRVKYSLPIQIEPSK
jgi:beta-lactamase regulating signal transducer with metallopeptidase domain